VATLVLFDDHTSVLFDAVDGSTFAVSVRVLPLVTVSVALGKITEVAGVVTRTTTVACLLPSWAVTVTRQVPLFTPVTRPAAFTVAIAGIELVQTIVLLLAFAGVYIGVNVADRPLGIFSVEGVNATFVKGNTGGLR
jgi:hypothetical protein